MLCSDIWLEEKDEEEDSQAGRGTPKGAEAEGAGRRLLAVPQDAPRRLALVEASGSRGSASEGGSGRGRYAGFNLRVVLNPYLTPDSGKLTRFNNRWLRRLKRWKAEILILTRTALYTDSESQLIPFTRHCNVCRILPPNLAVHDAASPCHLVVCWAEGLMLQEVRDTLEAVREAYPDLLVLWRNAVGGHPRCSAFTRPLRRRPDPTKLAGIIPADWGRHAEMNSAVRPLLRVGKGQEGLPRHTDGLHCGKGGCCLLCYPRSKGNLPSVPVLTLRNEEHGALLLPSSQEYGAVYLDVEAATALRPDGHHRRADGSMDCRHYCMPGPLDHWVALLHNTLRLLDRHERGQKEGEAGEGGSTNTTLAGGGAEKTEQETESLIYRDSGGVIKSQASDPGPNDFPTAPVGKHLDSELESLPLSPAGPREKGPAVRTEGKESGSPSQQQQGPSEGSATSSPLAPPGSAQPAASGSAPLPGVPVVTPSLAPPASNDTWDDVLPSANATADVIGADPADSQHSAAPSESDAFRQKGSGISSRDGPSRWHVIP